MKSAGPTTAEEWEQVVLGSSSRRLCGWNGLQFESEAAGPTQTQRTYRNLFAVHCTSCTRQKASPESIECFIEDQAFLRQYDLAPPHPHPTLVSKLCIFLSLPLCRRSSSLTGGGIYKLFNTLCVSLTGARTFRIN